MAKKKYIVDNVELMSQWNMEKNAVIGLDAQSISCGSHKKAWWKCENGHDWEEAVEVRNRGYGCPFCSGKRAVKGKTDFATVHPELLSEWDYIKNDIHPYELLPSSSKKVWWKCEKGHAWQASLNSRHNGTGCPICSKEVSTSFPEMAIYFYLSKYIYAENRKKIKGKELDIFIPSLNVGIEYDGSYYHSSQKVQKRDEEKTAFFKEHSIFLIRIKESNFDFWDKNNHVLFVRTDAGYQYLENVLKVVECILNERYGLGIDINVDIGRDRGEILNKYKLLKRENSLFANEEILSKEWNYEKNNELKPEYFDASSRHKVWWKCEKGHEWEAAIYSRKRGNGCPYCSNQKVLINYNDLGTIAPDLADEWNYKKNKNITPQMVTTKSDKKVWWKCKQGHEWEARISNRLNGNKCPYCGNKKVLKGYNDLKTWCQHNNAENLICEFDYTKNEFDITEITYASGKKVWWLCPKNHSYNTYLTHRTQMKTACPICSHKKLLSGYNDLATTHPQIAKEWDWAKNIDITPADVMAGSNNKKYWFKCEKGHSYQSTLLNRKKGRGCPYCYQAKRSKSNKTAKDINEI